MKKILIFCGTSASGKSFLASSLKENGIPEAVSHTTRQMRDGEVDGREYYFVSQSQFDKVEMAERVEYAGNCYGLSRKELDSKLEEFGVIYLIMDIVGVRIIKEMYPNITEMIFISVTPETMIKRLNKRGGNIANNEKRVSIARDLNEFSNHRYADHIFCNDLDDDAVTERFLEFIKGDVLCGLRIAETK